MRVSSFFCSLLVVALAALGSGCSCDTEVGNDDGGAGFDAELPDGEAPRMDGEAPLEDGAIARDGTTVRTDGASADGASADGASADGATSGCAIAQCDGRLYACGNCVDDDSDGATDDEDSACIGPCDDTEDRYDIDLRDTPTCMRDCYYDNDQGPGNDGCRYDARCDPLSPDAPTCEYVPGGGGGVSCPDTQEALCDTVCGPLVPNGCDCFGCCELPAGSGEYVFLGGVDPDGMRTCSPETVDDPTICRPCTPYGPCLNECGHCELCIGRTELPDDCFPPPPADAGPLPDGSVPPDAGTPDPRCEGGGQPCGLPSDPECPPGEYCLTGCCIFFG